MIIKTKKMSAREVKKKMRDFIDEISEDCGPEMEQMADDLKMHSDEFIDALTGEGNGYHRNGGGSGYNRNNGGGSGYNRNNGGGYMRDGSGSGSYRHGGRAYHRDEGDWEEREKVRKENEQKLQELDRQMQELRQHIMQDN